MMRLHAVATIARERRPPSLLADLSHLGMHTFDDVQPLTAMAHTASSLHILDWNQSNMRLRKIRFRVVAAVTVGAVDAFLKMDVLLQILHRNEQPLLRLIPQRRLRMARRTLVFL